MNSKNVNLLKSPSDFTELLSLSELSTQMKVLEFLQCNMLNYQRDYVKSFIKTKDEVLDFIPAEDVEKYFPDYITHRKPEDTYIVDTKYKMLIEIHRDLIDSFKFRYEDEKLICEYSKTNRKKSEYKRDVIMEELVYYKLVFDMGTNELIDHERRSGIYTPVGENGFYKKAYY